MNHLYRGLKDCRLWGSFMGYLGESTELFFPRVCASCWSYGESMGGTKVLCPLCDRLVRLATLAVEPTSVAYTDLPIYTAGRYEYELARCILAFKEGGRTDLTPYLVSALTRALATLVEELDVGVQPMGEPLYLVPLPSSKAATRRRGYAPAPLLAVALSRALREQNYLRVLPALEPTPAWQRKIRGDDIGAQKTLGRYERWQAMHGKLCLGKPLLHAMGRYYSLRGISCVLVDDVVTTGASFAEAQRVLAAADAKVKGAIAVARVP